MINVALQIHIWLFEKENFCRLSPEVHCCEENLEWVEKKGHNCGVP